VIRFPRILETAGRVARMSLCYREYWNPMAFAAAMAGAPGPAYAGTAKLASATASLS
jgi:hypothetical protein